MSISFPAGLFKDVCQIIEAARQQVAISVNSELTLMYWHIGLFRLHKITEKCNYL